MVHPVHLHWMPGLWSPFLQKVFFFDPTVEDPFIFV